MFDIKALRRLERCSHQSRVSCGSEPAVNGTAQAGSLIGASSRGDPIYSETKAKCNFLGVGPRIGLDIDFKLGCGVSLFGQGAASLVFGRFERNATQTQNVTLYTSESFEQTYDAKGGDGSRRTITMTDLSIGIMWEHCFHCCNRSHPLALTFAREQHAYYDVNNFNFVGAGLADTNAGRPLDKKHGDLTTQGLTISLIVGF